MGIPVLPFYQQRRNIKKPLGNKYLKHPTTLGEKLRNRRLELHLLQKDVADIIGVSEDSITYWENNRFEPQLKYYPGIIQFLNYFPFNIKTDTLSGKLKRYRYEKGWSYKRLASEFLCDEKTITKAEIGQRLKPQVQNKIMGFMASNTVLK